MIQATVMLFLTLLGITLIGFILTCFWRAFSGGKQSLSFDFSLSDVFAKRKLAQCQQQLELARQALAKEQTKSAFESLKGSFCLDHIRADEALLIKFYQLNLESFELLVNSLAGEPALSERLSLAESLIEERNSLLMTHRTEQRKVSELKKKRKHKKKDTPKWGIDEFERSISEMETQLAQNKEDLRRILLELLKHDGPSSKQSETVLH